jgi:hypothetical protein
MGLEYSCEPKMEDYLFVVVRLAILRILLEAFYCESCHLNSHRTLSSFGNILLVSIIAVFTFTSSSISLHPQNPIVTLKISLVKPVLTPSLGDGRRFTFRL